MPSYDEKVDVKLAVQKYDGLEEGERIWGEYDGAHSQFFLDFSLRDAITAAFEARGVDPETAAEMTEDVINQDIGYGALQRHQYEGKVSMYLPNGHPPREVKVS